MYQQVRGITCGVIGGCAVIISNRRNISSSRGHISRGINRNVNTIRIIRRIISIRRCNATIVRIQIG